MQDPSILSSFPKSSVCGSSLGVTVEGGAPRLCRRRDVRLGDSSPLFLSIRMERKAVFVCRVGGGEAGAVSSAKRFEPLLLIPTVLPLLHPISSRTVDWLDLFGGLGGEGAGEGCADRVGPALVGNRVTVTDLATPLVEFRRGRRLAASSSWGSPGLEVRGGYTALSTRKRSERADRQDAGRGDQCAWPNDDGKFIPFRTVWHSSAPRPGGLS